MIREEKWKKLITVFLEYNSKINLSALRDEDSIYKKHILDSTELLKCFDFTGIQTLADIGTGGGFPLLPLALENPQIQFTGIDSVRKKLQAIQEICMECGITNCTFDRRRIEECKQTFDCVTARAVAHVEKLLPRCKHMLRSGSYLILYKQVADIGDKSNEGLILKSLLGTYNLKLLQEHHYSLFEGDITRVIYVLQKQ